MKTRIVVLGLLACLLGLAWYFYSWDERPGDDPWSLEKTQRTLQDINPDLRISLEETGTGRFHGTATAKDGSVYDLIAKAEGRNLQWKGKSANGSLKGGNYTAQPPTFFQAHPRLLGFLYACAMLQSVVFVIYFLLPVCGLRQAESPRREKWLGLFHLLFGIWMGCALLNHLGVVSLW